MDQLRLCNCDARAVGYVRYSLDCARETRCDKNVVLNVQLDLSAEGKVKRRINRADPRAVKVANGRPVQFGRYHRRICRRTIKAERNVARNRGDPIDATQVSLANLACDGKPAQGRCGCGRFADNRQLKVGILHGQAGAAVFQTCRTLGCTVINQCTPCPCKHRCTANREGQNRRIGNRDTIAVINRLGLRVETKGSKQQNVVFNRDFDGPRNAVIKIGIDPVLRIRDRRGPKDRCVGGAERGPI